MVNTLQDVLGEPYGVLPWTNTKLGLSSCGLSLKLVEMLKFHRGNKNSPFVAIAPITYI
jgi:hypothetical protein